MNRRELFAVAGAVAASALLPSATCSALPEGMAWRCAGATHGFGFVDLTGPEWLVDLLFRPGHPDADAVAAEFGVS